MLKGTTGPHTDNTSPRRQRRTPEAQRRAILEAAAGVFLERGYAGASIDAVVERAGGSKATIYGLFGNKEGLFSALVTDGAERIALSIGAAPRQAPLEETLRQIGRQFLAVVLAPERVALVRLVIGESGRLPQIGDIFYRQGPRTGLGLFTNFFRDCAAHGLIEAAEPEALAASFIHLLLGDLYFQVLFNPTRAATSKERERHVDFVVRLFLNGRRRPGGGQTSPAPHP